MVKTFLYCLLIAKNLPLAITRNCESPVSDVEKSDPTVSQSKIIWEKTRWTFRANQNEPVLTGPARR